jgi:peptidyl-prolyl cis-trans isomerase C
MSRALFAACLSAAGLMPLSALAEEKVVATVNGQTITETEMNFADQEVGAELGSVPAEVKRRYLVEYLIETELLAAAAEAEKLTSGPEFEQRVAYMRQRAMREAYFDKAVRSTVDDKAARVLYDEQVKMLPADEEIQARHILVKTEDEAKAIAAKLAGGGDFAALAKENSTDAGSKAEGGMLGFFGKGQMVPQFEEAAFALQKGQVSAPVQSQFGWHIVKLEDRRQKLPPTFEEVKGQILGSLIKQQAQTKLSALRGTAKIEYVDADLKKQVEEDAKRKSDFEAQQKK